ncbi:MAG: hypothetical protein PHV99_03480 [Candidatus Pacebacteria bacterium]|nr:hypothetical protein [Candidatus Paceibacterota bacterium]
MRSGFLTSLVVALALPLFVSAQTLGSATQDTSASFTASVSPQYPSPHSQATLSFLSSTIDLANSVLKVSVDGKSIYQGSIQPVSITLGSAGTVTNVIAELSSGGTKYTETLSIQPQDIALIAEPLSSAPVLYQGKPHVPLEGDTRIVAVANVRTATGKSIDPSELSYSWTVEGMKIADSSGIGKSTLIVTSPIQYRTRDVSVFVASQDGTLVGGGSLSLTPQESSVRIYENDPLLGLRFDRALANSYVIQGTEATLFAAPFSLPTTNGSPSVQWFLNGDPAQTGNLITLRPTGSGEGAAALSLTASAAENGMATAMLSLAFGIPKSTNFFGL